MRRLEKRCLLDVLRPLSSRIPSFCGYLHKIKSANFPARTVAAGYLAWAYVDNYTGACVCVCSTKWTSWAIKIKKKQNMEMEEGFGAGVLNREHREVGGESDWDTLYICNCQYI